MPQLYSAANQAGAALGTTPDLSQGFEHLLLHGRLPEIQRRTDPEALETIRAELGALRDQLAAHRLRAAEGAPDSAEALLAVIRKASIRKQRTQFEDDVAMAPVREVLAGIVATGAPLVLVLPIGGGKVAHPLKSGDVYLPDLAEWVAATHLGALAAALSELHRPGARVVMLPDAGLHSDDLVFSATEHRLHMRALHADLARLGIGRNVEIVDTLELLPEGWVDEVERRAADARLRLSGDAAFRAQVDAQVSSLRFSMNLRVLGWDAADAVRATTALTAPNHPGLGPEDTARAQALLARTRAVAPRYVGTNHALRTMDLPRRAAEHVARTPLYVRLTVHAKPGEPRPELYPSSRLNRPGLLPIHGVGVREPGDKPRVGAFFHLEARMRGFEAVHGADGRFLYFERA